MSRVGHKTPYVNPEVARLEALPQAVVAYRRDLSPGEVIPPHRHARAQLVHASAGVMTVTTAGGAFAVPPQRAVWVPAGVEHRIEAHGRVEMRTVYVAPGAVPGLVDEVRVLRVTPLLRELILALIAAATPGPAPDGPAERLAAVILDQIRGLSVAPLALPMPRDPRLLRVARALVADPADARGLSEWAGLAGASERTLARLFRAETGLSFRAWRQQLRLIRALERLAAGDPVTTVALDLGYSGTSAFTAMFRRALGSTPTRYLEDASARRRS